MTAQPQLAKTTEPASPVARHNLLQGMDRVFETLPRGLGWASYPFHTLTLGSWFQPIFCVSSGNRCGYEGLLHSTNLMGKPLRADTVFAMSSGNDDELFLDWLCRALHLRNAANLGSTSAERGLIFLNAFPHAAIEDPHHPQVFERMLTEYGIAPSDVVVEILETGVADESRLIDAATLYRKLGCKIAIDDFGVGYSNFDRLWRIRPDFVKIDRSVIKSATQEVHASLVLANMIRLIKSVGARVIVEGIEDHSEARLAIELGADMLQGYYFARPSQQPFPTELAKRIVANVLSDAERTVRREQRQYGALERLLETAATLLTSGKDFPSAIEHLLATPSVVRAYLLQRPAEGAAAGSPLLIHISEDQAWLNLPTPASAIWRVQNILERTLAEPTQVQFTAPLAFDAIPPAPTITLSRAVGDQRDGRVVCVDLIATDTLVSAHASPLRAVGNTALHS